MNTYEFISCDYEVHNNSVIAKFKGPDKQVVITVICHVSGEISYLLIDGYLKAVPFIRIPYVRVLLYSSNPE
jgi:hypothetical protein